MTDLRYSTGIADTTLFLERSEVRSMIIQQFQQTGEPFLKAVDALPIFSAEDIRGAAQRPVDSDIVARLRAKCADANDWNGELLKAWDRIRQTVETHKGGDLPRLMFESLIEDFTEPMEKASDVIEGMGTGAPAYASTVPTIPLPLWAAEDLLKWMPKVGRHEETFYPLGLENLLRALVSAMTSTDKTGAA